MKSPRSSKLVALSQACKKYGTQAAPLNDFLFVQFGHPGYVKAMRKVAAEKGVPLIGLSAKGIAYFDSVGAEATEMLFLRLPQGQLTNLPNGICDSTHFQEEGAAAQMSRLVAERASRNKNFSHSRAIS